MNDCPVNLHDIYGLKVLGGNTAGTRPFYFMLNVHDGATVRTVKLNGTNFRPDISQYRGPVADMLTACENYETTHAFGWCDAACADTYIVDLHKDPSILHKLVRCTNITSRKLNPIAVAEGEHRLLLKISEPDESGSVQASLCISITDEICQPAVLLSDEYALASDIIYKISPVGCNYSHADIFLKPFEASSAASFIALFLSYFNNIDIVYRDRPVIISDEPVDDTPALVIEKLDSDKSLYLRLVSGFTAGGAAYTVDLNDSAPYAKANPVINNCGNNAHELLKLIRSFAPDKEARKDIFLSDNLFIIPEATASGFLTRGLSSLLHKYRITGLDNLKEYKVQPVKPQLKVYFSSGIDFLEGKADVDIEGIVMSLPELIEQYRRQHYILLNDGTRAIIDSRFMDRIERLFRTGKDNNIEVSFFDLPDVELIVSGNIADSPALRRPREFYRGFASLPEQTLELPDINAILRSYQKEGVKWMKYLYDNNMGGCLADDMGLGKTLQVISLLTMIYPAVDEPTLIIMPRSLLFNWSEEIRHFAPQLDICTYYGQSRSLDKAMSHQVILTTYAVIRNDAEILAGQHFHMVVLDESQTIKNFTARQTRSVIMLKSDKRFALSGTPIENNLSELYSLFRFLNPAMFGSMDNFNREYVSPMANGKSREVLESLRRRIFPFMLRRLKKDVLDDLPARIDQTMYVEMSPEHARFYEERRRYYLDKIRDSIAADGVPGSQFVMFQALSELRRIASVPDSLTDGQIQSPKIDLLAERIESAVDNGHKAVVFFNFIAGLEILAQRLEEAGIPCLTMTGATHDRSSTVNAFQNNPEYKVLIMTLKTGGVGLNLTAADTVFIAEPWWNKAAEEQAINRLHRIGQKSTVFCFSTIVKDSIEEKIRELQHIKAELFNDVIGSDNASSKNLTEEDINFILS